MGSAHPFIGISFPELEVERVVNSEGYEKESLGHRVRTDHRALKFYVNGVACALDIGVAIYHES
jgi:hypothetical protein